MTRYQIELDACIAEGLRRHGSGDSDVALTNYWRVLSISPAHFDAWHMGAVASLQLGRLGDGLKLLDRALVVDRGNALAYQNRGVAKLRLGQQASALPDFCKAMVMSCASAEPYVHCAKSFSHSGNSAIASTFYGRAKRLDGKNFKGRVEFGNWLFRLADADAAVAEFSAAMVVKPDHGTPYFNAGLALQSARKHEEALRILRWVEVLNPGQEDISGTIFLSKTYLCIWDDWLESLAKLRRALVSGNCSSPWQALTLIDEPALQLQAARGYLAGRRMNQRRSGPLRNVPRDRVKLRVGYFSADFHEHATAHLIAELIESHNREEFEIFGFSFGPPSSCKMRERLRASFDMFFDVRDRTDREISLLSRELGVDIAVDLKGHTRDERFGIFVEGCAPIQVAYLGYPGTTGSEFIDYIIADKVVIPTEDKRFYSEKVVYLPGCYQANDSTRSIAESSPERSALGLPNHGFIFCCFNTPYKIHPTEFDCWMRILRAVEGSVLWLIDDNPTATKRLRSEALGRGINPDRLIFAPRVESAHHLARLRRADLFLDTFDCNAHTTASDALWAGLPLLTRIGNSFPSRVSASLLKALGLDELVTNSTDAYESTAIEMAHSVDRLEHLRRRLALARLESRVFDGRQFARSIEKAFKIMVQQNQSGLPPEGIEID